MAFLAVQRARHLAGLGKGQSLADLSPLAAATSCRQHTLIPPCPYCGFQAWLLSLCSPAVAQEVLL